MPTLPWSIVQIGNGREQIFSRRATEEEANMRAAWLNRHMNGEGTLTYEVRLTQTRQGADG